MVLDPQQAQEHFLDEVRNVGRISDAREQEAAQPLSVLGGDGDHERTVFLTGQRWVLREHTFPWC